MQNAEHVQGQHYLKHQRGTHPGEELVNVHELVYRAYLAARRPGLQPEATTPLLKASVLSVRLGLVRALQDEFQWMGSHQLW